VTLAIFDLDNTLLAGDSDYLWGRFVVATGLVDRESYEAGNRRFYEDYEQGVLDIRAFTRFVFGHLKRYGRSELEGWRDRFIEEWIRPIVAPASGALLASHRRAGHRLMILTATNAFVTRPIAELLGVELLLATEPEIRDDRYTGEIVGTPCYQEGKVLRLREWLRAEGECLAGSWCYSDSHNDLPILQVVENPVAVDPDQRLAREARERRWPVVTLRAGAEAQPVPA
jgi:HAD superfamily hydrolase (TIGR01490 family)